MTISSAAAAFSFNGRRRRRIHHRPRKVKRAGAEEPLFKGLLTLCTDRGLHTTQYSFTRASYPTYSRIFGLGYIRRSGMMSRSVDAKRGARLLILSFSRTFQTTRSTCTRLAACWLLGFILHFISSSEATDGGWPNCQRRLRIFSGE